jgi:tRNA (guanosine-2'-O-)-methyltransferase
LERKHPLRPEEKVEFLERFITEERKKKINRVLKHRIKRFSIVLENIYDPHNISAVLRTADGLGFMNIFVIEKENRLKLSQAITTGAEKWLNVEVLSTTREGIEKVKQKGYKIAAGVLAENTVDFTEVDWLSGKWAILLGNEHEGLTEEAVTLSDVKFKIPIYGFIQSYNISVTAAMIMFYLQHLLRQEGIEGELTEEEILQYKYMWLERDTGIKV